MTDAIGRQPRGGWIAACCVLAVMIVAAWVGGHLIAGKGGAAMQCTRMSESSAVLRLGFDSAADPDAIPQGGEFLVFPTGLRCESVASGDRTERTWWISWPESLAVVLLTLAFAVALAGAIAPRRTVRLLRQER